jgi:hypothetical protein
MELENKIIKAQRIVESMSGKDYKSMQRICRDIKCAQNALNIEGKSFFKVCSRQCKGICCKNINVNDVVTQLDLIYILFMQKDMIAQILQHAKSETFFTADCPFLKRGVGPCIFPANVKPERCIITFCGETLPVRREIKTVRSKFSKLSRFTKIKRPFLWIRF